MLFQTYGNRNHPAVLFFHAMGVTGESSEPVANYLQDRYFCILPTSTVYCEGQKYVSKLDEIRQVEDFLHRQGVERLAMVVASSIGADLAMAFLTQTKLPVEYAFFDGGLVFDVANRTAVKMIAKTWLKSAKIKDVGAYFAVSDAKSELSLWDSRLLVTSRSYMLGYNDLRDPSVSGFFRFLAKVGDGMMKMQIVKIGFGGK